MSQRLCIGPTQKTHWDAIIDQELTQDEIIQKFKEWIAYYEIGDTWGYFGYLSIYVADRALYEKVKPTLNRLLLGLNRPQNDVDVYFKDENKTYEAPPLP